jgi:hypothetical protein
MKLHTSFCFGMAILAILVTGCGLGNRLPCPGPGEELADAGNGQEKVALTLKNDTCMSVCLLLVSPNHCEYMEGVNWVEGYPLRSGESVTREIPPGQYAVWVELCSEEFRADENLNVKSNRTHSIVDGPFKGKPPCNTSLTIINNSPVPVCKLSISNTESAYTSRNWLGIEPIQPGESLQIMLRPDTYIIRAEDCDGNWLRSEIDVPTSGHQTWSVP